MSGFVSKLKFVPSLLTCSSAFCGILATILAMEGEKGLVYAAYLIFIAAVFDFSDGFAARLLGAASELGKQLDSLADAISFGVAPTARPKPRIIENAIVRNVPVPGPTSPS